MKDIRERSGLDYTFYLILNHTGIICGAGDDGYNGVHHNSIIGGVRYIWQAL
ncbi:hypothetical protein [Oceanispirochaeta sp.]|uniref:hypothetical protein n=1 Tax=Oceanispirochaeta sp. TaxID=2035350 RepID=UPI002607D4FF|nr:hypothetical protein [Oceanispirochaeta sp.]MDA3958828.1 hypothetical protein [Oceanispirochaeta sp.]